MARAWQMGRREGKHENRKKGRGPGDALLTLLILAAGLSLLAYPWISNALMKQQAASSAAVYAEEVDDADDSEIEEALSAAREYNAGLQQSQAMLTDPFDESLLDAVQDADAEYESLLNLSSNGVMCYIDIPAIDVYLPVYHGTSDSVLTAGIGHLEGSSLPVGGKTTHTVLTGHTGLSSAKLFTDLDELEEGDYFYIHVLDETLAYVITEIQVVEPSNTDPLLIREGEDLVTLVTCTPYGVNSHRLFVTGTRTEYEEKEYTEQESKASSNATKSIWMLSYRNAILIGLAILLALQVLAVPGKRLLIKAKGWLRIRKLKKRQVH